MEFLNMLSRKEMKNITGGDAACMANCNAVYGGFYEECGETYHPSTDNWALCVDEVYSLNTSCLNSCIQVA